VCGGMLPHALTSGMCDLHVRWGDQWIVSGLQGSKFIIVQEVFVAISNFSLFCVKFKLIYSNFLGAIAEYPAYFEWHKFLAPVVLQ